MTIKENRRKIPSKSELLVTAVLAIQFFTYLFTIFGNPIKAGFEIGRKVENLQTQFMYHCQNDSTFRYMVNTRFDANAADHLEFKSYIYPRVKALMPSNTRASGRSQ